MRGDNEAGIILNWLAKIVIILGVIGVVGFDVGSVVINAVTLDSSADEVAIDISLRVDQAGTSTDPQVYLWAVERVNSETEGIEGAKVLKKGTGVDDEGVVHIRLKRKTNTLVAGLIGPLEKYTVARADGQAGTQ